MPSFHGNLTDRRSKSQLCYLPNLKIYHVQLLSILYHLVIAVYGTV